MKKTSLWKGAPVVGVLVIAAAVCSCSMVMAGARDSACRRRAITASSSPVWYLAEGSTAWGFSTSISIINPNDGSVPVRLSYSLPVDREQDIDIPALSQATVYPESFFRETMGQGEYDFSTTVECLNGLGIAVSRTMSWKSPEDPQNVQVTVSDWAASTGVTSPSKTWYLPEGSSAWGFETWLLIQNPGQKPADCTMTYMIEGEGPQSFQRTIPPLSRQTFGMIDDIGQKDASIRITSSRKVIAERSMFRNARREGHESIGTPEPNIDFYLAEGTTGWGYTTYVLVQNPQASPTDVTVTYMTAAGTHEEAFQMPASSRKTINVNLEHPDLPHPDFSTRVHGSAPIIAERAMYWNNYSTERCHDSVGLASPHQVFYLPGGWADFEVETWTLVQNPNASPVAVTVSYLPEGEGTPVEFTEVLPGNSRRSYNMADRVEGSYGVIVESIEPGKPVMAEISSYLIEPGSGLNTIGGFSDP